VEPHYEPQTLCEEIAGEVRDIAISLCAGRLRPDVFEQAVKTLEMAKLQRFGYRLTTERLTNGSSRFHVIQTKTGHECATLDFDSATERLEIHQICG
jgi:hypothetical protein